MQKGIEVLDLLEEESPLSLLERNERESLKLDFMRSAFKEEVFLCQRSWVRWFKEGDKKTKFFS